MKAHQQDLLRAQRISQFMDSAIVIPGTGFRIGVDPILGLIPGLGDFIANAVGLYPISLALKYNLSKIIVTRMVFNLGMDYLIGQIPFLGDLFDAFYKANQKNVSLFEKGLSDPRRERKISFLFLTIVTLLLILLLIAPIIVIALILGVFL